LSVCHAAARDININSTSFGQATLVGTPRNVQIRVKFSF
jgi:hypothetical protein